MKRPYRRIHLLIWLILAPATAIAGYIAWQMRPAAPYSELPPGIETLSDEER